MAYFRAHPEAVEGPMNAYTIERECEELATLVEMQKRLKEANEEISKYDFWFFCEGCREVKVRREITERQRDALDQESICLACKK